jgi:hypothetical protein
MIKIDCITCMARDLHFSLLKSTQTGSGAYLYYAVGAGVFFLMGKAGGGKKLISYLHLLLSYPISFLPFAT